MKRILKHCLLVSGVLALTCCQSVSGDAPGAVSGPMTFTATIGHSPSTSTKTTLGGSPGSFREVHWSSGDKVVIGGAEYNLTAGAGTTSGTLTGSGAVLSEGVYKAYYPTDIWTGAGTPPALPSEQIHHAGGRTDNPPIDNLPMYAQSSGTDLQFHNLCAVLNLRLRGTGTVTSIEVQGDGYRLNGPFTVGGSEASGWYASLLSGGTNTVTLVCTSPGVPLSESSPGDFFIALPAGTYGKGTLTVTVKGTGGVLPVEFTNKNGDTQLSANYVYSLETPAPGLEAVLSGADLILWSDEIGVATWDGVVWNAQRVTARDLEPIRWD